MSVRAPICLARGVGIVADFSYHKKTVALPAFDLDFSTFAYLFGPRVTARGHRVEGFAHALIGGVRRKVKTFADDKDLALGLGGGVDIKATDNFAVRLLQVDYLPFRDRDPSPATKSGGTTCAPASASPSAGRLTSQRHKAKGLERSRRRLQPFDFLRRLNV